MMEIVLRKDDGEKFEKAWVDYARRNNVPWSYVPRAMEYMRTYSRNIVEDLSFVVMSSNNCMAIAPLFLEKNGNEKCFTYAGSYLRAPLSLTEKAEKEAFAKIDELAAEKGVSKAMLMVEPASWLYAADKCNPLQRYGYLDSSIGSHVIRLDKPENALLNSMRHGHESLIKSRMKEYSAVIVDSANPDFGLHEVYRETHRRAAGRVTRPKETFDLQFEMLKHDEAMLVCLKHGEKFVGFSYFFHGKKSAYYGSGADEPDFDEAGGVYHMMLWEAIRYYRRKGIEYLETGWQQFGLQVFDHPSAKDIAISHFKRGFGGTNVPLFRGIKYYDYDALEKDIGAFLAKAKGQ